MGCAKDIVEYCGVPRFLFSDFPLGNAAGRPNDPDSQAFTLELALRILEAAPAPRTTVQSPLRWSDDPSWKLDYSNIERLSAAEIAVPAPGIRSAEGDRQDCPRATLHRGLNQPQRRSPPLRATANFATPTISPNWRTLNIRQHRFSSRQTHIPETHPPPRTKRRSSSRAPTVETCPKQRLSQYFL